MRLLRLCLQLARVATLIWQIRKSIILLQRDILSLRCFHRSKYLLFLFMHLRLSVILTLCYFQLFEMVVEAADVSDEQKSRICKKLGEADKVTPLRIAYFCFSGWWFKCIILFSEYSILHFHQIKFRKNLKYLLNSISLLSRLTLHRLWVSQILRKGHCGLFIDLFCFS